MLDYTQKFELFIRMLLPGMCTIVLLLMSLLQVSLAGLAQFPIDVCLISIYYWTIFRPNAMPFWFVFVLGVIRDALMGAPLGITSLVFILFRLFVLSQQRFLVKEAFLATWLGFGLVMVPAMAVYWLLSSAYVRTILPLSPLVMQWIFTFGFYPLLHILFNALYSFLPGQAGRKKQNKLL
jgi:rod shape-determining protein MreD